MGLYFKSVKMQLLGCNHDHVASHNGYNRWVICVFYTIPFFFFSSLINIIVRVEYL